MPVATRKDVRVVAAFAAKNIGARSTGQGVRRVEPFDKVIAIGRLKRKNTRFGLCERCAIGKIEKLNVAPSVARIALVIEAAFNCDRVISVHDTDDQACATARPRNILRCQVRCKLDPVRVADVHILDAFSNDVVARSATEQIGVRSVEAAEDIVARAPVNPVRSVETQDGLISRRANGEDGLDFLFGHR